MTIHIWLLSVLVFNNVIEIQSLFRITSHTICKNSDENDLNIFSLSLYQCLRKCSRRSACIGLTYKRAARKCTLFLSIESLQIFQSSAAQTLNNEYNLNQCVLIQRDDINMAQFPVTTSCESNREYDLKTGVCTIRDCPWQHFEIGETDGNMRNVGSRLVYTCHLPFFVTVTKAICMENGTWSFEPECSPTYQYLLPTIPNEQITASSVYNDVHGTDFARLDIKESCVSGFASAGGWVAQSNDPQPFIQAMFDDVVTVNGVVIKGRDKRCGYLQYAKTYTVSHSLDPDCLNGFTYVLLANGIKRLFEGSSAETEIEVYSYLEVPIQVRCIRLYIADYYNMPTLRFDVLGGEETCSSLLVSGRYGVPDDGITASSWDESGFHTALPHRARLDTPDLSNEFGGWFTARSSSVWAKDYIQVTFRTSRHVVNVITQGVDTTMHTSINGAYNGYTETYSVSYSKDCVNFMDVIDPTTQTVKIFTGNDDMHTRVENYLPEAVDALCFRVTPDTFNIRKGLRFDLRGCVDHVCPESSAQIIRPYAESSYKIKIVPGTHTYLDAVDVCIANGGSLINLDDNDKRQFIKTIISSCSAYAGTQTYWMNPTIVGNGTAYYHCVKITNENSLVWIQQGICPNGGFICEWILPTA